MNNNNIYELNKDKTNYKNLKEKLATVRNCISNNQLLENLDKASSCVSKNYVINNVESSGKAISNIKRNISSYKSAITSIINDIDYKISKINDNIESENRNAQY